VWLHQPTTTTAAAAATASSHNSLIDNIIKKRYGVKKKHHALGSGLGDQLNGLTHEKITIRFFLKIYLVPYVFYKNILLSSLLWAAKGQHGLDGKRNFFSSSATNW
jgi:hypothetical protein